MEPEEIILADINPHIWKIKQWQQKSIWTRNDSYLRLQEVEG